ncbi:MAG TPA: DUF4139 domain-containing protein [Gemmataceae bacterium]|jgi:hypothetical protein|nr:DUF4139 domain-containing protein [Gemmataceae bacterium]
MSRNRLLGGLVLSVVLVVGVIFMTQRGQSAPKPGQPDNDKVAQLKPAVGLPISQVILFNSGVGHFTRSGEVEGDARVDLTFPEQDINDLIKSMTLRDLSPNGRVAAVTYDSHDPIDRTLASFAINLNNSPSLAQILTQARGEQVEVTLINTANQPGNLTGKIMGVEQQAVPSKEGTVPVNVLNMWCAEGVRVVKLTEVQRLRFANPVIENEVRRALETLAMSHDAQKKAVSLHFAGEGKRKVEVGYVVENPIWKTSYRLVLDKAGEKKPYLQGWAIVENPTDEDWNAVTMALVSGRPISFKMDLYNPLYVARPTVEPELFASLRPIAYSGAMRKEREVVAKQDPKEWVESRNQVEESLAAKTQDLAQKMGKLRTPDPNDLTFAFKNWNPASDSDKKHAAEVAQQLKQLMDIRSSVNTVATASSLGDYYQYVIDRPVDLARQKSSLLLIVNKDVEGKRVSIYNAAIQPKHPLLGLKFKNTTGMPLTQGPVTVYEGSVYAGDTRVLDLQPDEERLVSYAIDLGTEVSLKSGNNTSRITSVKAVKGIIHTHTVQRQELVYDVSNRSTTDRTLLIEHPNRKGEGFVFIGNNKPKEEAADVFRFEIALGAKKDLSYTVLEEKPIDSSIQLTNNTDDQIRYVLNLKEASPALKAKLHEALGVKAKWDKTRQDIQAVNSRVQAITVDQKRLRDNLRETPKESPLFQRYLKTLEEQEKEMDDLSAKLKSLQGDEAKGKAAYDEFLANLSAE